MKMFSIFDRYIARSFTVIFLASLMLLQGLFYIIDLLGHFQHYISHINEEGWFTLSDIILYYLMKTPIDIVFPGLQISVLIGALFCVARLSKDNEIISMMSNGVSFRRIVAPLFIIGLVLSLSNFFLNETVMRDLKYSFKQFHARIMKKTTLKKNRRRFHFFGRNEVFYEVRVYKDDEKQLKDVVVIKRNEKGTALWLLEADNAYYRSGPSHWEFTDASMYHFNAPQKTKKKMKTVTMKLAERPDDFAKETRSSDNMNINELYEYIKRLRRYGDNTRKEEIALHQKVAFPFSTLFIMLIGAVLGSISSKSVWVLSFLGALVASGSYWILMAVGKALSQRGDLLGIPVPPVLGAWLANIVFVIIFFVLLHITRKG